MQSYCAVYVDAGYLLASAATRVAGTSLRGGVDVDHPALIEALAHQAVQESGLPLLRINWYDAGGGSRGSADASQDAIGMLPRVKLRLGRRSPAGDQKGVDLRIGLDLATHGRNRIVDVIYLISGDDDLTEAVEEAQAYGVQVVILAAPDAAGAPYAVAKHLQREADGVKVISPAVIDACVTKITPVIPAAGAPNVALTPDVRAPTPAALAARRPPAPPVPIPVATFPPSDPFASVRAAGLPRPVETDDSVISAVARDVLAGAIRRGTSIEDMQASHPYIPGDLDRAMLIDLSARLGIYDLDDALRYRLRDLFWIEVDQNASGG